MSDKHIVVPLSKEEEETKAYFEKQTAPYPKFSLKWHDLSKIAREGWTSRMLIDKEKSKVLT